MCGVLRRTPGELSSSFPFLPLLPFLHCVWPGFRSATHSHPSHSYPVLSSPGFSCHFTSWDHLFPMPGQNSHPRCLIWGDTCVLSWFSCDWLCDPWIVAYQPPLCHALLQGILGAHTYMDRSMYAQTLLLLSNLLSIHPSIHHPVIHPSVLYISIYLPARLSVLSGFCLAERETST